MKRFAAITVLATVALVAPAQADRPDNAGPPDKPDRPAKPAKPAKAKSGRCTPRTVGFQANGTLMSATLTPAAAAGRFDGTMTIDVKRANHRAPTGEQTYTLTGARVNFRRGVDAAAPAAGSRVRFSGKITRLAKRCPTDDFTPTVTVRKVDIRAAKAAAPTPAPEPGDDGPGEEAPKS